MWLVIQFTRRRDDPFIKMRLQNMENVDFITSFVD